MTNIQKLYIIAGFQLLISSIPKSSYDKDILVVRLIVQLALTIAAFLFIQVDARSRKISQANSLWGFLSPIGIVIYHLFFASRKPIKK